MAKRSSLASLLETPPKAAATQQEATGSPASTPVRSVEAAPATSEPKPAPATPRIAAVRSEREKAGERFDDFTRKEARLREDQIDDLAIVARRLSRQRASGGPRITENTLIRVAVDRLLADQARLSGETEDQLRKSVGL